MLVMLGFHDRIDGIDEPSSERMNFCIEPRIK
jgi:hypothetical protein